MLTLFNLIKIMNCADAQPGPLHAPHLRLNPTPHLRHLFIRPYVSRQSQLVQLSSQFIYSDTGLRTKIAFHPMFNINTEILTHNKVLVQANKGMCLVLSSNQLDEVMQSNPKEFVGISTKKGITEGDPEHSPDDTEQPPEEERQRRPRPFFVKLPRFRFMVYYTFYKIYFLYVEHSDTYRFMVEKLRGDVIYTLSVEQFIRLLESMESHQLITVTQLTACRFLDYVTSKEVYKTEVAVEDEEGGFASRWSRWFRPSKENPFINTTAYFYDSEAEKREKEQTKTEEKVETPEEDKESATEQPSSSQTTLAAEEKEKPKKKKTKIFVADTQPLRRSERLQKRVEEKQEDEGKTSAAEPAEEEHSSAQETPAKEVEEEQAEEKAVEKEETPAAETEEAKTEKGKGGAAEPSTSGQSSSQAPVEETPVSEGEVEEEEQADEDETAPFDFSKLSLTRRPLRDSSQEQQE